MTDRLEREIEAALDPGRFVSDGAYFCFVDDLEEVEAAVAKLVEAAPARAIALYEAFRAGCYENADEVDDSSGSFAMLVTTLVCGWIKAGQAAGVAPDATATRLLAWMDDDPFGFCYQEEGRRGCARQGRARGVHEPLSRMRRPLDRVLAHI